MIRSLVRRGPGFLWLYFMESVWFDLVNRTNTHMRVPKPKAGQTSGERRDGLLYVASLSRVVRRTFRIARDHLGSAGFDAPQFLDLGCGKGKTLLIYANEFFPHGGKAAVGVEYDQKLCEIALSNLMRVRDARQRVHVHCDSAVNLAKYVDDGALIVYLYNSFQGETLRAVLERLAKYPHVLIYVDPVERSTLARHGYETVAEHTGKYNADTWVVAARC